MGSFKKSPNPIGNPKYDQLHDSLPSLWEGVEDYRGLGKVENPIASPLGLLLLIAISLHTPTEYVSLPHAHVIGCDVGIIYMQKFSSIS
jgi:fumarate reductase subunit C